MIDAIGIQVSPGGNIKWRDRRFGAVELLPFVGRFVSMRIPLRHEHSIKVELTGGKIIDCPEIVGRAFAEAEAASAAARQAALERFAHEQSVFEAMRSLRQPEPDVVQSAQKPFHLARFAILAGLGCIVGIGLCQCVGFRDKRALGAVRGLHE